jgi:hypothetical protein
MKIVPNKKSTFAQRILKPNKKFFAYMLTKRQCNFSPVSGCLPAECLIPLQALRIELLSIPVTSLASNDVLKV